MTDEKNVQQSLIIIVLLIIIILIMMFIAKLDELANTHTFYPVAIETGGTSGLLCLSSKLADGPQ